MLTAVGRAPTMRTRRTRPHPRVSRHDQNRPSDHMQGRPVGSSGRARATPRNQRGRRGPGRARSAVLAQEGQQRVFGRSQAHTATARRWVVGFASAIQACPPEATGRLAFASAHRTASCARRSSSALPLLRRPSLRGEPRRVRDRTRIEVLRSPDQGRQHFASSLRRGSPQRAVLHEGSREHQRYRVQRTAGRQSPHSRGDDLQAVRSRDPLLVHSAGLTWPETPSRRCTACCARRCKTPLRQ